MHLGPDPSGGNRTKSRLVRGTIAAAGALALVAVTSGPASADNNVVADGVISPLDFAVGYNGTVYVAEAFIGQITAFPKHGGRKVLVTGAEGQGVGGVDVALTLSYTGTLPPEVQDGPPADTTLNRLFLNGKPAQKRPTSMLEFETTANPDQVNTYGLVGATPQCVAAYDASGLAEVLGPAVFTGIVESNPYAVAIDAFGSRVVADAAGNSILRVSPNGEKVSTIAVLPPIAQTLTAESLEGFEQEAGLPAGTLDPCIGQSYLGNPVPTDIEIGPGGHYYVSTLPGFPENPGAGQVYRINRFTGAIKLVASGFTGAVDIAVARDGTIYVAELFAGQVSKVVHGRTVKTAPVDCPTAIEITPFGKLLVAEGGICGDGPPVPGRIVRLPASSFS